MGKVLYVERFLCVSKVGGVFVGKIDANERIWDFKLDLQVQRHKYILSSGMNMFIRHDDVSRR